MQLLGAVLAGGRSTRFGSDKAYATIDGEPLIVRCARALRDAGASEVVVIGGDRTAAEANGLRFIEDAFPDQGPLGGLLTAMDVRPRASLTMILPCDLAQPSPDAIAATVATLAARPAAACAVPHDGHRPQWMHSCWRRSAARDAVFGAFEAGARSFADATAGLAIVPVAVDPAALLDIDTPEDHSRASDPGTSADGPRD